MFLSAGCLSNDELSAAFPMLPRPELGPTLRSGTGYFVPRRLVLGAGHELLHPATDLLPDLIDHAEFGNREPAATSCRRDPGAAPCSTATGRCPTATGRC